jgi:GR25 family glycosyltransferase involved in LPS biosynthesis
MINEYPIYCINLEHRKDRKKHSMTQFTNLGFLPNKVNYPHFIKDSRGGVYGCFDSHIKIWTDFFVNYPNQKYALIFEDDFLATNNSKFILKNATKFIANNYDKIDILFLHNMCVDVDNNINNSTFTSGYGLGMQAYFITRHYIKSIIDKYGQLPDANGRHIDYEICFNIFDNDNKIYSNKCFFSKNECFKQLIDKSDNYLNFIDEITRIDINKNIIFKMQIFKILKKIKILNDNQIKTIEKFLKCITTEFIPTITQTFEKR